MSRRRKSKARKQPELEPEDILEGRVEARFEDLFDLIHRVNPTLKKMPKKEQTRRYAIKNRLQSLLIRRFGDEHLKVVAAARQGVVSLEHVSGVRDACHAVVAELEPDARSWVLRRLDIAASGEEPEDLPAAPAAEPAGGDELDDLLWRGRQALEDYDYEAAEEHLRQAFARSHGAAESRHAAAALALLELRVDLLGLDAAALEIEPRLSTAARKQPGIRTLLALAAARLGHAAHALELLAGLIPATAGVSLPRAAEAYAALTAGAIRDRDRQAARRHLEQVVEFDPAHPGILRLENEIAGLRAEDQRAFEAELERRFMELGAAAVEEEARALADRWPEGEVARRILRQAAADRRGLEIAEHLKRGDRARREERLDDALEHFRAALDAGAERPGLPDLVAELAERARERQERAAVDDAVRRLSESVDEAAAEKRRPEALRAYLSLAEDLKARVRERVEQPALGWLDELDAPESGARARAAAAVAALEQARAALDGNRAQDALDLLQPHRGILRQLAVARGLWRDASRWALEERQRQQRAKLDAARAALEEGRPEDSRRLLGAVVRGDLAGADRARWLELQARIDDAGVLDRLAREHDERLAAGDLPGALVRARWLAEGRPAGAPTEGRPAGAPAKGGPEHAAESRRRWRERFEDLQGRLRTAWKLEEVNGEWPASRALMPARFLESSLAWLDDAGHELVLANAWDHWLFIDAVDVARGTVTARVSLRIPAPLEHPMVTFRDGDRLWVAGRDGDVFEIARDGWRLLGYYPVRELVSGERTVERVRPLPGSDWLWVRFTGSWEEEICLVDLRRWRIERRFPFGSARWLPLIGGGESRMLVSNRLNTRLYNDGGEQLGPEPLVRENVLDADLGPDGRGLMLLAWERESPGGKTRAGSGDGPALSLIRLPEPEGADPLPAARLELPQAYPHYSFHAVVTSPDAGRSFVLLLNHDRDQELLTFSPETSSPAGKLEPLSRTRWSGRTTLVRDRHGRHVAAATLDGAAGVELEFLTPPPEGSAAATLEPAAEAERPPRWHEMPGYKVFVNCGRPTGDFGASVDELEPELEKRGIGPLRSDLARLESSKEASISEKMRFALALRRQHKREYKLKDAIAGFARRVARKHRRDPGAVLLHADLLARDEKWDEVSPLLRRAASPDELDDGRAQHFHHLEGLAHLQGGRLKKAHAAFRRGVERGGGTCALEPLLYLTRPMSDPPAAEDWAPDQPSIQRLVGAIRTADHALAAGDPAAARAALDRRDVRCYSELQSAARRASLYLDFPARTAADRFDQRAALSFYAHLRKLDVYLGHSIFLPGLTWDDERLEELEERVFERLDELGDE